MPAISLFFGIIISMYADDHQPPHFHAQYQQHEAIYSLDGTPLRGELPPKQHKLVVAWAQIHQEDLEANWHLAERMIQPHAIEPLR